MHRTIVELAALHHAHHPAVTALQRQIGVHMTNGEGTVVVAIGLVLAFIVVISFLGRLISPSSR